VAGTPAGLLRQHVAEHAAGNAGDHTQEHGHRRGELQRDALARADDREQRQRKGVGHQQHAVRELVQPPDKERGDRDQAGIQQVGRVSQPGNRRVADEEVAHGPAAKGRDQGQHHHAEEVHALAAGGEHAGDRSHADGEMFQ